jgi:Leucine-rich repeat (LRR) protein
MAELVATMVVGPLLSIVKDKASSYLLDQYNVMEGMEEQHRILKRKLPAILDVIADAEEAASHREGAKAWLVEVKRVAYEANDIFDEFKYEALRRQAKKNRHCTKLGVDVIKLFPTHNRFVFRKNMGKKLCMVVQAIEVLVAEMNAFGFKHQQQAPASKEWRKTDHVIFDPNKIISRSRGQDTRNIVDTLLRQANNANLTVVPIVGIGGLGKTTLAQLIYNEPEIQKHFELLLWVCVSDSFDVNSLAKSIAELHHPPDSKKVPLDMLQAALRGRRYLLVLDDVWNRDPDKWEKLRSCLTHGAKGSVVLTTTRDEGVAKIMGTVKAYNLAALGDKFIKEIIESRAFSLHKEEERPAVLVNMVDEIVKRCRGSPLAATALGSVLRTKTSEEEWKAISSRSSICTEESGILPILKLSYNDLSSQMKQCFAFCAMFPKDYVIDVGKLIQLWIAHGIIHGEEQVTPEIIGNRIFSNLASRSFFVDVKKDEGPRYHHYCRKMGRYNRYTCKIHDLMHDIALSAMENECVLAPEKQSQIEWLPDTVRHVFLSCDEPETVLNDSLAKRSPAIQTLLCDGNMKNQLQHLSKYSSLKALQLRACRRSIPLKSKHLHLLRYLDLSRSLISSLPEDISILYNLETLDVSGCDHLRRLPRQMKYMTALCHLYTHGCLEMESMPSDLRKLVSLQTLTCFVAGPTNSKCSDVGELQQLNLGGQLELHQLENVTEEAAKAANIRNKKELGELRLKWTVGCEDDAKVLDALEPHDGLQAIKIESYGGTTFPEWMSTLRKVVEIRLIRCKKLQWLFSSDASFTFPNLKKFTLENLECLKSWWKLSNEEQGKEVLFPQLEKLSISGCPKLTALPEASLLGESYGTMARSAFPALEKLKLKNLQSFESWEAVEGTQRGHIVFPKLEKLTIEKCPLLQTLPEAPSDGDYSMTCSTFPALKVLKWENTRRFGEDMILWVARHMTSLVRVELGSCGDTEKTLAAADDRFTQVVGAMEKGNHNDFPLTHLKLTGFKSGGTELYAYFIQLECLDIVDCAALVHWPEKEFQSLVSLKFLMIWNCQNLVGYAQSPAAEPSTSESSSQLLPCLEFLHIVNCRSLLEVFRLPASMIHIRFAKCCMLKSIFTRRLQQEQSATSIRQGPEVSSSPAVARAGYMPFPCLEALTIDGCSSFTGVLYLPPSLKYLNVDFCNEVRSVESHSGAFPFLEELDISSCKTLSSLPDGPQLYSSLYNLSIMNCPGLERLPTCLQQRLSSLKKKELDARYQGIHMSVSTSIILSHVSRKFKPCFQIYYYSSWIDVFS